MRFERDGMGPLGAPQRPSVVSDLIPPRGRPGSASMECPRLFMKRIEQKDSDWNSPNLDRRSPHERRPTRPPPASFDEFRESWRGWLDGCRSYLSVVDSSFVR